MIQDLIEHSLFNQTAFVLIFASLCGFLALKLRQPLIITFIGVGILAGPSALNVIGHDDTAFLDTLAELGVTILLFMVGLKLDLGLLKQMGTKVLIVGTSQVLLTSLLGTAAAFFCGFTLTDSILIGIALSFSSTIIVIKLLSDKRAIDSLYGRMALGVLIIQDIAVIAAMLCVSALAPQGEAPADASETIIAIILVIVKLAGLTLATFLFIRYAAKPLTKQLSRSPELTIIFSAGLAVFTAAICHNMGLSRELGGLVAGVMLASTPHHNLIAARLLGLRDFMLLFFFVILGAHIDIQALSGQIIPAIFISIFVLLGKPVIVYGIMRHQGYRSRTSFLSGTSLAQTSEFSFIFIGITAAAGLSSAESVQMMTLVGILTMAISSYVIIYNAQIHRALESKWSFLREASPHKDQQPDEGETHNDLYDVIVIGLGRYGFHLTNNLQKEGFRVLAVDFDPEAIKTAQEQGIPAIYGDAADPEGPAHLPLAGVKMVVLAFHHYRTGPLMTDLRRTMANAFRAHGYEGSIACTSHSTTYDHDLHDHGINLILRPFEDAASDACTHITRHIKN